MLRESVKNVMLLLPLLLWCAGAAAQQRPNVIYIYADDLGYGDLSCYGATKIRTPYLDRLASQGLRFTDAHSASATCTPSRYALMTGTYPWRQSGTGILPGDAALIVPTDKTTLPRLFRQAGYATAIVGKWHLGLGTQVDKNWNETVSPGPNQVGFDYSFIFPATADRVPTVFMENGRVLALEPADPIAVDYQRKVGNDPTGRENPELLRMKASPRHGHDNTIVNGIGRIGYMQGGHKARWVDEEISTTFLTKAKDFIAGHERQPFFLYFALTEPHVPRMPATLFKGQSALGYRGDAILQLDWTVGQIMRQLEETGLADNTILIFSSDNGPVLDDGYQDEAVTRQNGHLPAGPLRGGKYSVFEGGTRVPFILRWPRKVKPGVSEALLCQMDLPASFAELLRLPIPAGDAPDSQNLLPVLLGKTANGRRQLVEQGAILALVQGGWKYISPSQQGAYNPLTGIETGNLTEPQLYNLREDIGERNNLASQHPDKVQQMAAELKRITENKD